MPDPALMICHSMLTSASTLVLTESSDDYQEWIRAGRIKHGKIEIATNKDGVISTTIDSICESLLFVMDSSNHPVYIHCNQGKHRTGCLVGCLRKVQRMPIKEIIAEYRAYSGIKARPGDEAFIKSFDPEVLYTYAKAHGRLDGPESRLRRNDSSMSIVDVDSLVEALGAGAFADELEQDLVELMSSAMSVSTLSEEPLELKLPQPAMEETTHVEASAQRIEEAHVTVREMQCHGPVVEETTNMWDLEDVAESDASSDTEMPDGYAEELAASTASSMYIDPALETMTS